jgi:hypothetical protein
MGGIVKPDLVLGGFSRENGVTLGTLRNGTVPLDPLAIVPNASLFGGISLRTILDAASLKPADLPRFLLEVVGDDPFAGIPLPTRITNPGQSSSAGVNPNPDPAIWDPGLRLNYEWQTPALTKFGVFEPKGSILAVSAKGFVSLGDGSATWEISGRLNDFLLSLPSVVTPWISLEFESLSFTSSTVSGSTFTPSIRRVYLGGDLSFVQTIQNWLKDLGGAGLEVDIREREATVSYKFAVPRISLGGALVIRGLRFRYGLLVPFDGNELAARFAIGTREDPFLVSVSGYAGAGFFGTEVTSSGPRMLEVSLEFGGDYEADFGVAKGHAFLFAGIYIRLSTTQATLEGFVRTGGYLDVLRIGGVSVLAVLRLTYITPPGHAFGSVEVVITFSVGPFSYDQRFTVQKTFAGSPATAALSTGDEDFRQGAFGDLMSREDWREYWAAFA